ncbi:RNA polymerase sigma factor [Pseudomonas paralcaligenes]|uniref:RNA polymerase sigma factor n=1 Tax=Pseudomonas paralcaligenes TaxID=2772558 RepID=UPI001C817910|nr:RNA polymerase sigma factor [Pseudomonas paralcaligenes]
MVADADKKELDELFIDQRTVLVRMLARVVGCASLAEDLAQEAYLKVAQALPSREVRHLRAFLYQTAQHLAFDHLRSQRSRRRYECPPDDTAQVAAVPTPLPGPESHALGQQQWQRLQQVLARLPQRQQRILLLHRLHGLTQGEIAKRLDVSLSTVEKDLRLALAACLKGTDWGRSDD